MGQSKICFAKIGFVRLGQLRSQEISSEESAAMISGHEGGSISWPAIGQIHIASAKSHLRLVKFIFCQLPFVWISEGCAIPAIAYFIAVWKENHLRPGKSSIQKAQLAMDI
jgi:hypothetical protein